MPGRGVHAQHRVRACMCSNGSKVSLSFVLNAASLLELPPPAYYYYYYPESCPLRMHQFLTFTFPDRSERLLRTENMSHEWYTS